MENKEIQYVKRTQKDYTESFKLSVVQEVESGSLSIGAAKRKYGIQGDGTIRRWLEKYGIFGNKNHLSSRFMQSPAQKIKELQARLAQLERENAFLEERLQRSEDKAMILDKVIDLAEEKYLISVRKNFYPNQSAVCTKKKVKP